MTSEQLRRHYCSWGLSISVTLPSEAALSSEEAGNGRESSACLSRQGKGTFVQETHHCGSAVPVSATFPFPSSLSEALLPLAFLPVSIHVLLFRCADQNPFQNIIHPAFTFSIFRTLLVNGKARDLCSNSLFPFSLVIWPPKPGLSHDWQAGLNHLSCEVHTCT